MKLQIKSDLHLSVSTPDFRNRSLPKDTSPDLQTSSEAEVLILAGDIVEDGEYNLFRKAFSEIEIPIIYVPGNHEYWGGDIDLALNTTKLATRDTNVSLLVRNYKIIYDTIFIGATLWTPLLGLGGREHFNGTWDMSKVRGLDPERWQREFELDFGFIKATLENPEFADLKKVVITHHLPSYKSVPERFKNDRSNIYFASNVCEQLMESNTAPELWIHGHTHDNCDYIHGNTRVICNPYGYFGYEINQGFQPELVVEV
jgi:predicted phosphodiesterase